MDAVFDVSLEPTLAELLRLAAAHFGAEGAALRGDDDLLAALGIDSLQAMELLTRVEEAFGVEIPDYELADVRTFAELARLIRSRQ